jgi:hypothetical protein
MESHAVTNMIIPMHRTPQLMLPYPSTQDADGDSTGMCASDVENAQPKCC